MKPKQKFSALIVFGMAALALGAFGISRMRRTGGEAALSNRDADSATAAGAISPEKMILVPHRGETPLDQRIAATQDAVRAGKTPEASIDLLGWLFIEKARVSSDPGYFKLAEQCALTLEARKPGDPGALLLRGHVLQNLHQFKQAEPIARKLVAERGAPFDYGLLGDVLVDLGQIDGATDAYQKMMDLRPDSQAFARAAHVRWLRGDLAGAVEAMREAARIVGTRNASSAAWMNSRLAFFQLQSGNSADAEVACSAALSCVPNYPPALLVRGRMQIADGNFAEAVETLRAAVAGNPLPEYLWAFAEALRSAGRAEEAAAAEAKIVTQGVAEDPRTVSLYLATRGEKPAEALRLAERELENRADIFTHDALAWALAAEGNDAAAWKSVEKALREGTQDARLFLHAAVIASKLHRPDATDWIARARKLEHLLLPSEVVRLHLAEKQTADTGSALAAER